MSKYDIIIGIDPGVKTGIAIFDCEERKLIGCDTKKIHQALQWVSSLSGMYQGRILIRIENAKTWVKFKRTSRATADSKLKGAGSIRRDCTIWEDYCNDMKIPYELVPLGKVRMKMDAGEFQAMTGWKKLTSSHARDAGCLVWDYKERIV